MERILVTTDLSDNSLAGLRFAIQLATQRKLELIFFHANDLWNNTTIHTSTQTDLLKEEKKRVQQELESFVEATYRSMHVKPGKYRCVLHYHFGVINSILDYATHNDCHFICISTHGAGNVLRLLGSNTRELISESDVPVLCIPRAYEPKPVNSILYASDMTDHETELARVVAFAKPIHATINVLNITQPGMPVVDKVTTESRLAKKYKNNISIIFEERDPDNSLAGNIDMAILKYSPSLLVMFTNQDRNLLELLFAPSQTEKYSFRTKIPLLACMRQIKSS